MLYKHIKTGHLYYEMSVAINATNNATERFSVVYCRYNPFSEVGLTAALKSWFVGKLIQFIRRAHTDGARPASASRA